jgi:hypothetical protein
VPHLLLYRVPIEIRMCNHLFLREAASRKLGDSGKNNDIKIDSVGAR